MNKHWKNAAMEIVSARIQAGRSPCSIGAFRCLTLRPSSGILRAMKLVLILAALACVQIVSAQTKTSLYDIPLKDIDGKDTSLKAYQGKVLLVVNVASKCGFTPQYEALQAVHKKYERQGFTVLGFPCNDFGAEEPGTPEEINQFGW